jgi:hypothetical protein
MNSTYEAFITIAKISNINMDSLFAYYKAKEVKTEEVKTEEVKTEEVKTEEVKTEEVKAKEVKTEEVKTEEVKEEKKAWVGFQTGEKKKSWADYEDDEEEERNLVEKKENESKSYRDVVSPNYSSAESKTSVKSILTKESSTSDEWETLPTEEEFIKVSKKHNHKKNLPVVHSLEEFIDCIKEKKKPNVDFIIHDTAHCSHTFEGTLCKDVRRCKKIHIQRCIAGEKCKNKNCPYLHRFDMPDNEAKKSFSDTMSLYNKIKPKKQVKSVK